MIKKLKANCALYERHDKINEIIDWINARGVTDNQNKVQKPSSDGSQKSPETLKEHDKQCGCGER